MQKVDPLVIELIDSWATTIPAFVMSPTLEVLAVNRLALALSPLFAEGTNLARVTFFDEVAQDGTPRAARLSELVVDLLKVSADRDAGTRDLRDLVGELSSRSHEFARVWADPQATDDAIRISMTHSVAGVLDVSFHHLQLPGDSGQTLVVARVDPGSSSQGGIQLLAESLADQDSIDPL